MDHLANKSLSDILARLLENEDRYAHRVAQADVLRSEITQLQTDGNALIQTLHELWAQRRLNPSATQQHTTVINLRDRLQSLYTQARTTCEKTQLDPSAQRILDGIIQQLLDVHRVTSSISVGLTPQDTVTNLTDPSTSSRNSFQSTAVSKSSGSELNHQHLEVVKPIRQRRASQVLTCSDSIKAKHPAQNNGNRACSEPNTTIEHTRPYATCSPLRRVGVKVEAGDPERVAPTPLEARMIKCRNSDDQCSDDTSLWWSDSSRSSIDSV